MCYPGNEKRRTVWNRGFILLDTLLGVLIFGVGVLFLGRAVSNCIDAQSAMKSDQLARLALENRLAEIEAGAVPLEDESVLEMKGNFDGIKIVQTRVPLEVSNENEEALPDLWEVHLTAKWEAWGEPQSKELTLYVYRPR
jgi:Tfp pilus assembly protein PilV